MAREVTFQFNTIKGNANDGKIVVTMLNSDALAGTPYDFYIGVTSPSGEVLKALPTVTPDATLDGGADETDTFNVDIPLDADGAYLGGTYVFTVRRDDGASDDTTVEKEYLYVVHNAVDHFTGTPSLVVTFNCATGVILATDTTDYAAAGLNDPTREIEITPPSIDPQGADDTTDASLSMTVAYTYVTYGVRMSSVFSTDLTSLEDDVSVYLSGSVELYDEVEVTCETGGICGSLGCLSDELTKVYNQACAAGGYPNLPSVTKDRIVWSMMNLTMAKLQFDCGNTTLSQTYLTRAKEAINCGCGCADESDPTPAPYTPPYIVND